MEAGYACERTSARAEHTAAKKAPVIVVVLADAALHRGAGDVVDSVRKRVDDDCAGRIVRFSLAPDGH